MDNEKYAKESYIQPDTNIRSSFWDKNILAVLLKQYSYMLKGRVVDFGCNHGVGVGLVSELEAVDAVVGFDINRESLARAHNELLPQIPKTRHKVEFFNENLADMTWTGEQFDFAYSIHTLEHIFPEDVAPAMTNMANMIKTGGWFLMNLPEKESYAWEPSHVYKITLKELDALMDTHGFDRIESYDDERGGQHGPSKNITGLYKKR